MISMIPNEKESKETDIPNNLSPDDTLNKLFDVITGVIYLLFGKTPAAHFLSFWVMNFMIYIVALGAVFQFVPPHLEWVNGFIFYGCIIMAGLASVYSTCKTQTMKSEEYRIPLAIIHSLQVSVVGVIAMMALYALSFYYHPMLYVQKNEFTETIAALREEFAGQIADLRSELRTLDLNDRQISQIFELLRKEHYLTKDELPEGLSEQQIKEVLEITNSLFQSRTISLTAMPESACYLTLLDTAESVYIRDKADKSTGIVIDYLNINEVAQILGNNKYPDTDWWYIEINHRGKTTKGWIGNKWVKVQNEENCELSQMVTPSP
jgi:hypothetical protein